MSTRIQKARLANPVLEIGCSGRLLGLPRLLALGGRDLAQALPLLQPGLVLRRARSPRGRTSRLRPSARAGAFSLTGPFYLYNRTNDGGRDRALWLPRRNRDPLSAVGHRKARLAPNGRQTSD